MQAAPKLTRRWIDWRTAMALTSGILLALAYPGWGFASLAWLSPGLLLLAASGASPGRTLGLGYLAGLVHFLLSLSWLTHNPFPAGAIAGWIALSAYVAVYPALWVWLCWRLAPTRGPSASRSDPEPSTPHNQGPEVGRAALSKPAPRERRPTEVKGRFRGSLLRDPREVWTPIVEGGWFRRTRWVLFCAALWVALEMVRARLFTGFPWNLLGVSQYDVLPLIQIARVTGVYGVSYLVVWSSIALIAVAMGLVIGRTPPSARHPMPLLPGSIPGLKLFSDLGLPLLAVLVATLDFGLRTTRPPPVRGTIRLALIQPSIPQELIFDPAEATNRFGRIMELSRLALETKPDVLIWPENSLPSFAESHLRALTNLIATHRVWMIFGADDVARTPDATGLGEPRYYNSAFLFDPEGRYRSTYRKCQLVIFGEYIPLEKWLPITKNLTPIQGSFSAGDGPVAFRIDPPRATTSVLICFEDTFPRLVRHHAGPEIDFLLNLTNDAWFGESSQHWQHAANAVFRAVENGLPLIRCANNGLTCWIDHLGRVRGFGVGKTNDVHAAGFRVVDIPLRADPRPQTFYQRYGDVFGWACCGLCGLFILGNRYRRS